MRTAIAFFVCLGFALAADADRGAVVFRQSCAVGYCHGSGGAAGRAPRILGRAFDHAHVLKVTRDGIPNTGMPAWKDRLSADDLNAVVAYTVRISGGTLQAGLGAAATETAPMPQEAARGKALFFDAIRAIRCGTCHSLEGIGTAVGPNLAASAYDVNAIRAGKPASIRQARTPDGDSFPALLVEQTDSWTKVYDLTVAPPVLRTFAPKQLSWSGGAKWDHAKAVAHYSGQEIASVAAYLRWLASR
jgi:mono/diheme cytochrome c family protein